jgi:hypothetical protein
MNNQPTPETDAVKFKIGDSNHFAVHVFYAQKLERERDEALNEGLEQARLLGMSGEREAKLIAERDSERAKLNVAVNLLSYLSQFEDKDPEDFLNLFHKENHDHQPTPTPETDAQGYGDGRHPYVATDFARRLERERDNAQRLLECSRSDYSMLYSEMQRIMKQRDEALAQVRQIQHWATANGTSHMEQEIIEMRNQRNEAREEAYKWRSVSNWIGNEKNYRLPWE